MSRLARNRSRAESSYEMIDVTSAARIVNSRSERVFDNAEDLARRAELEWHEMKLLAAPDALMSLSGHRRQQVWDAAALRSAPELLREAPFDEEVLELPPAPEGEEVVFDYASLGLSSGRIRWRCCGRTRRVDT